jgi:glycosyltransferase involved in cell wall biosynthesis
MGKTFTVVIPVHLNHRYWKRAIQSVANQIYKNFELIVSVNSRNFPMEILKEELSLYNDLDSRIVESFDVSGVSHALNVGVNAAKGEFIVWLSSDDYFDPDRLQSHINFIHQSNDVDIIYSGWKVIDENGSCISTSDPFHIFSNLNHTNPILVYLRGLLMAGAMSIRKSRLIQNGLFDVNLLYTQDYSMWYKLSLSCKFLACPEITTFYQYHENQTTRLEKVEIEVAKFWDLQIAEIIKNRLGDTKMTALNYIVWQTNILIGANYNELTKVLLRYFEIESKKLEKHSFNCVELKNYIENINIYSGKDSLIKERNDLGLLAAGYRQLAEDRKNILDSIEKSIIFRLYRGIQKLIKYLS